MPSFDMMREKPSPREVEKKKPAVPPEKPRTLRTARTARTKRPTLRLQPRQEASEAEKQLDKIRSKLKDKQEILHHPEALIDAWEALRDFHHPNHQPSEQDLNRLRDTLQKALYEYQARTEKIQTLRVSKTLRTERSQEFEEQREQLEKILSELMESDNPSQAKQDSAQVFNDFVNWREQQQNKSMEKQVADYEAQADRLLEKEQNLQEQIQTATGQAVMGNSAEETAGHLKLNAWQKIKDWVGTLTGKKPVIQLIAELAKVQRQRVVLDRKITDLKINLGQDIFRVPDKEIKTEAQAMRDFELEDLIDQTESAIEEPGNPEEQADTLKEATLFDDELLNKIDQEIEHYGESEYPEEQADTLKEAAPKEDEFPASINRDMDEKPEAPVLRKRRQMKKLRLELKLMKQARQDVIKDLAQPTETRQDIKTNERYQKMLAEYEQRIAQLENKMANLSSVPEKLEELEPVEKKSISSKAPPPPSAEERERYLDIQATFSGRDKPKNTQRPALDRRPRTMDEDEELYEQTRTIIESASKLAAETVPAEQFELPKRRTVRQPKSSVILALEDSVISDKIPTARTAKELSPAYTELQQLIKARLRLLSKEDRLSLNFDSKTYAEKAMNRDQAYAEGNDKEGEAYQASINQLNKILNQAGVIGDHEDPSMHTGGKSKGLKILGGEFLTKNLDQYTKLIPPDRKTSELKKIQRPETANAPTLSVAWAKANLGEQASEAWSRVAPIIAERNLGPAISGRLNKLMQETAALDLKNTSADYQSLPQLMDKMRADSAYTSSPEASAYVLLKAFKPKNGPDKKIQTLIDNALKAIDAQMLEIKPVVENFKQRSKFNKATRESRQSLRNFDLLPSKPQKKTADLQDTVNQFKQKNKSRLVERSISELSARDARRQSEILSVKDREILISLAGAKNAKHFGMLLDDYLQSLPLKDSSTALAQDRLLKEVTALGLEKDKTLGKLISYYTKETPKAPVKPRTARTKRIAK